MLSVFQKKKTVVWTRTLCHIGVDSILSSVFLVSEKESSGPDQNTLILIGAILSCVIICMAMFIMFLVWYIKRQAILSHQSANSLPRSISQGKGTSQTRSGTSKGRLFSLTKVPTAYPGVSHKVRVQVRQGLVHQKAGYSLSPECQQLTKEYLTR